PTNSDTIRQLSILGASVFDWQDRNDFKAYTLLQQKIVGTMAVQVKNETGMADRSKALMQGPSSAPDASGNAQSLPQELVQPGRIMYFEAGKGQGVEVIKNDNPSSNTMAFQDEVIREALEGMGWSFDYSHNPSK